LNPSYEEIFCQKSIICYHLLPSARSLERRLELPRSGLQRFGQKRLVGGETVIARRQKGAKQRSDPERRFRLVDFEEGVAGKGQEIAEPP
jgi:hypothetical protein